MASGVGAQYQIGQELAQAKMVRAILSERQLQEVMTDFWFNHFNVYIAKDSDQWYTTSYERDVIRRNALGKFGDLLLATAQSPAMLVYLDNWLSIGPDSLANGVNPANPRSKPGNKGLNENYGREIMELHTVGVNGGYTQADVTNLSAILTGWTVNNPGLAGGFQFDPKRHEPGTKVWLGHRIGSGQPFVIQGGPAVDAEVAARQAPAMNDSMDEMSMGGGAEQKAVALASSPGNAGMKEGLEALNLLAHSPQTAHFISWKIAQRFVADDPPPALVDRMAKTFLSSDGDIKAVLRTLVASPEFNSTEVLPQQSEDADGVSGLGVPHHADRSDQPGRAGEHDQEHGHAALFRAAADGLLHHRGQVDEHQCAGRPAELRLSADQWQVCQPEVRRAEGGRAGADERAGLPPQTASGATRPARAPYAEATLTRPLRRRRHHRPREQRSR